MCNRNPLIGEAAAKAAAEAAVPKPNLVFMEKPLTAMSAVELKTIHFFAGDDPNRIYGSGESKGVPVRSSEFK